MMGRQTADQGALFYEFRLEDRVPEGICCAGSMPSSSRCLPVCISGWRLITAQPAVPRLIRS